MAQLSDLAESALKRNFAVKDRGGLIPGHGGILDRFDSFILTGPILYYLIKWML
jgi:phosphatidate cytidylyltransferase